MSIEKITDRILWDAEEKASQIIIKADGEVKAVLEQAAQNAKAEAEKILAEGRKEEELTRRRILSSGEMEAKKLLLEAKQKLIGEAFEGAVQKLKEMDNSRFSELLIGLIAGTIETGNETVLINEATQNRLPQDFMAQVQKRAAERLGRANLSLTQEIKNIVDGFVLKRGDIEINMTFDAVLRQNRESITGEVVKILLHQF